MSQLFSGKDKKTRKILRKECKKIREKNEKNIAKKIFKPGDEITIEEVNDVFRKVKENGRRFAINENSDIKTEVIDGHLIFDTLDDMKKYYGGLYTIEEVFKW